MDFYQYNEENNIPNDRYQKNLRSEIIQPRDIGKNMHNLDPDIVASSEDIGERGHFKKC